MAGYLPLFDSSAHNKRRAHFFLPILGFSAVTFILCVLLFRVGTQQQFYPPTAAAVVTVSDTNTTSISDVTTISGDEETRLRELQAIVASTDGKYLTRDWQLSLGWNNMRYIIETGINMAAITNRTLVLPSFLYARGCQYDYMVCADYAQLVNRVDAVHNDEWKDLGDEKLGYRIPIDIMLNITHLRTRHPVITVAEFLELHNQSTDLEHTDGYWGRYDYNSRPNRFTGKTPSYTVLEPDDYQRERKVRVDRIPQDWLDQHTGNLHATANATLWERLDEDKGFMDWDRVEEALGSKDVAELEERLERARWHTLHTYSMIIGMDMNKAAVSPVRRVAPLSALVGLENDVGGRTEDILHIAGALLHEHHNAGGMDFTSREALDRSGTVALFDMQRRSEVMRLADKLVQRMYEVTGGRLWMAAHIRRGDFIRYGWVMEQTPEEHIARVKRHLAIGRSVVEQLRESGAPQTFDVPGDVQPDLDMIVRPAPLEDGPFYVGTDESDPKVLDMFRREGAVLFDDLLTIEDRRTFALESGLNWALMLTDVRAVVSQVVMAKSAYFYGHAMSSVPGGVMNLRAAFGKDPRTWLID
ncbi:hypothetical protein CYLTODRAFT_421532 [Cylindrobasidium torrendii FP15055 ss-10]|uniref:Uncharacterized protein n=1 Tax=Cylindrobasidium torrendii FP15055 ss-10 TaxID=1314674 RepID=A0A0D7BDC2_9AGAR|nr:hypothetical protein CYLTODRAFT_421532 [Cylindrobasidium torrendii FP15055 ss-10]